MSTKAGGTDHLLVTVEYLLVTVELNEITVEIFQIFFKFPS